MTGIFLDIDDTLYSRRALLVQAARETAPEGALGDEGSETECRFMDAFYKRGDENYPLVVSGKITPFESNVWRFEMAMADRSLPLKDGMGDAFATRYTWLQNHITMSEGLSRVLTELSRCPDLRLGVITNGASKFQWNKFRMLGLSEFIEDDYVIVSGDVGISKPEKGIFTEASSRAGLGPEDLWMVGDSVKHDIIGAKECGWHTLWLKRQGMQEPEVEPDLTAVGEAGLCEALQRIAGLHGVS